MRDKRLIQMYITNQCNSHCRTCTIWKNEKKEELHPYVIEDVIRAFPDADFVIGGGEAILHSNIEEILTILHDYQANYTLLSNCIAIGRLKELVLNYHVKNVTVSFDGIKHDEIRGVQGNRDKILLFHKFCKENGVHLKLSYTYSILNEHHILDDFYFIRDIFGMDQVYFCLAADMKLLMIDDAVVASQFDAIEEVYDMLDYKDKDFIERLRGKKERKACHSQSSVHTIYSNGNIVRCQSYMSDDIIGNVNGMSVERIKATIEDIKCIECPHDSVCNLLCQRRYD